MMTPLLPFDAELRPRLTARRLTVRVHPGGRVTVTVPKRCSRAEVLRFLEAQRAWIERTRAALADRPAPKPRGEARRLYRLHKEAARRRAYALIAKFAPFYGVSVRAVSIRDQKSRWGSCSRSGNLAFNYRLALLPERLAEYIVVHELCHLLEFNHSERFWAQVARTVPEHRALRKALHRSYPTYA